MTKEQEEAVERLSLKSITSSSLELNDYPNMICLKKDVIEVLSMLKEKDKDIAKKDRIIDEMAEKLNQAYCDENDYWDWFEERFGRIPDGSYAKKIKQYFKRKVEE